MDSLNKRIKSILTLRNITQKEVCSHLNISPVSLSRFLNGYSDLSSNKFNKLLKFLDVDLFLILENQYFNSKNSDNFTLNSVLNQLDFVDKKNLLSILESFKYKDENINIHINSLKQEVLYDRS
jgi:transcriptional regulator with XRE-family HTH domain